MMMMMMMMMEHVFVRLYHLSYLEYFNDVSEPSLLNWKNFIMVLTPSLLALVPDIFNRKCYQYQIIIIKKLKEQLHFKKDCI
jgi:hypothetical protein